MTEPPSGWSSPGGDAQQPLPPPGPAGQPQWGQPGGYGAPPQWGQPSGAGWSPPPGWGQPGWSAAPPALQPGVVPLRPLALGELLDGAIKIIRRYPRPTLGLSAAIAVVVTLINVGFVLLVDQALRDTTVNDSSTSTNFSASFSAGASAAGPGAIVSWLAGLVLTGALVAVVGKAVLGQPAPAGEVWATVRPRLWALLGLSLLTGLIGVAPMVVGILVAVVLGISTGGVGLVLGIPLAFAGVGFGSYLYIRFALAAPALVLEKAGITTALRRSAVLVKGSWWRVLLVLFLAGLIAGTLSAIISLPISLVALLVTGGDNAGSGYLIAQQVGAGLASVLVAPFSAGVHALLYVDRRMRAEGLDVALQAAVTSGTPA